MALDVLGDRHGRLAAADRAHRLSFADAVADLQVEIQNLPGQGRQNSRHAVLVELHFAGDRDRSRHLAFGNGLDFDRRQPCGIEHDDVASGGIGLRRATVSSRVTRRRTGPTA